MPDEALISEIENMLSVIVDLGGQNERTQIVPNLTIQDANPTGQDGFVIVSDDRDGDNILAKKVPSVTYTNSDLVNVLFPRGGEAIAFQQGSQSASGDLWEIVPSTSTDIFYNKGNVGIGTDEIPHEGVGWAKVAIDGTDFDAAGPHMQFTTDADDYPVIQIFPWGHDESAISFDSYYDGTWRSSTTDQNFQILATGGRLRFRYDSGVAAGAALTWNEGIALRDDGTVGIGTISPAAKLESVDSTGAQLRLTHTVATKFADFTVDTNHDLTITPSSTGGFRFQPTTDQTDSFQILDADGGEPIVNVNAVDEYVVIGTTARKFNTGKLEVAGLAATAMSVNSYSTDVTFNGRPFINLLKSHSNTLNTLTTTVDTERLGDLNIAGVDSNNAIRSTAGFRCIQNGAAGVGSVPSDLAFIAANNTEIMRITNNQRLGVGVTVPAGKAHIDQSSTTATIPVLSLDQADLSEEFINFISTIGAGNPIDTAAIGTYYGKVRVAVNGTFKYVALYNS